jgi:hypothetical protein
VCYNAHLAKGEVRVLSETTNAKNDDDYLPAWLRSKDEYTIWQRNNLWMLFNALNEARASKTVDPNITLIALWDGAGGDGAGGTADLVQKVKDEGAQTVILETKKLFEL